MPAPMTPEQIVAACHWARDRVRTLFSDRATGIGADQARHVAGMCDRIEVEILPTGQLDKANRWLGFVQGWLWTGGFASLDELREVNGGR